MALDNQDILFASLVGSVAAKQIGRFNALQNELMKHVLPPIPFLPLKNKEGVTSVDLESLDYNLPDLWQADKPLNADQQFFPLTFSFTENGTKWLFPYEPMITLSSGNTIVETNVAKQGEGLIGTIKERWSRKDFEITITGALFGALLKGKPEDSFPRKEMTALFEFLKAAQVLYVNNFALETLNINRVVIYDYSFPFTKGENVQAYEIKCKSDHAYNLLIEVPQK